MTTATELQLNDLADLQDAWDAELAEDDLVGEVELAEDWTGEIWNDPATGRRWYHITSHIMRHTSTSV